MSSSTRRMGSIDSEMAESMLDATEEILKEEGYAALTSRRIADYLGVKQRLLYYYFRTMDDLVLESFKRLSVRELARLKDAISSDQPLPEIWKICTNTSDARLVSEFMAIANRNEGVREAVIEYIEESRKLQVKALKKAMAKSDVFDQNLPAEVLAFIGTSMALALNREASLGVKLGHAAIRKTLENFWEKL
ncbi:helix-turn-helix domain-containing protein [Halioxenophilus sp. WMMB6]|uniref:TetR/AcrR family transcriptional regulator n=1 Tax=Halioxenophilus sp. WMMB6 TaxID=3073815 RepID=UPI00295F2030|nr:helix-turn-helix domain-containing protein [Halioxenophilus sp. WMMB6]